MGCSDLLFAWEGRDAVTRSDTCRHSRVAGEQLLTHIRPATWQDSAAWRTMRQQLWPEDSEAWHADEVEQYFAGRLRMPLEVLIAVDEGDNPIGFAELFIRPYAEGCVTDRVGYLEGWYVAPHARRQGVGRALMAAAEDWARQQGCTEFASDALIDNLVSQAAHKALGFEEVERIRCFRKSLVQPDP